MLVGAVGIDQENAQGKERGNVPRALHGSAVDDALGGLDAHSGHHSKRAVWPPPPLSFRTSMHALHIPPPSYSGRARWLTPPPERMRTQPWACSHRTSCGPRTR